MLIWLLSDGETLPGQPDGRKMRSWMLAETLVSRGHDVIWWASTFSHHRKKLLYDCDTEINLQERFKLKLLHCGRYNTNVSLRRYIHHYLLGRRFREVAESEPKPDIIVSAFPKIDLAYHALRYSKSNKLPIVVDVRDLWPDTYLDKIPTPLRGTARLALTSDFHKTKQVFCCADSLVSMSQGCLNWALKYAGRQQRSNDRVFYIGYPDDPAVFEKQRHSVPDYMSGSRSKIIFTYVGGFGSSYELRMIGSVAKMLLSKGMSNIHFVLAGDGDQFETISKYTYGLPNVTLPGWLNHSQAQELLAYSHVGLLPCNSVKDAMPNKIYEYLAAGLPILSSLEGEMQALIEKWRVGHSYKSGDAETLCNLVAKLANDPALVKKMSDNARSLFKSQFRCCNVYSGYASHIERMAMKDVAYGAYPHKSLNSTLITSPRTIRH